MTFSDYIQETIRRSAGHVWRPAPSELAGVDGVLAEAGVKELLETTKTRPAPATSWRELFVEHSARDSAR